MISCSCSYVYHSQRVVVLSQRWNWKLADMAQEWADACQYKHGQPKRDKLPFPQIGQNLWVHTGKTPLRVNPK